ncbi:SDR family NAD(P)-dependent oxidoreductase [Halovivax sp.]|uniref:SDR family NAD(P)-dependent oxidoreductase n=1 Tax=Halovivax sp. TaxID=1935978 RepID=UPI0025BF77D6|nr:SDR family oxidoreductase [Halovivax sp.]
MEHTTVVVTGAGSGLGRAVAIAFAARGATVVVGDADGTDLEETIAACEDAGAAVEGVRTDVRDEFDVERLVETASRSGERSGIDVVVAAAETRHGEPGATPIDADSYTALDDHWRTNARGVFAAIRESLAHLNEGARILVPTHFVAADASPGAGTYAVSKAGAEAVARGFAVDTEYAVGCVDPGPIATDAYANAGSAPEDVAPLFVWAATELEAASLDGKTVDRERWERATETA